MARAMVSLGMFAPLASETAFLRRACASGSPPPVRAATEISLISLVKSLPRLASKAPFLCLIVCHFECPDIDEFPDESFCLARSRAGIYHAVFAGRNRAEGKSKKAKGKREEGGAGKELKFCARSASTLLPFYFCLLPYSHPARQSPELLGVRAAHAHR